MSRANFDELLSERDWLLGDGATGTSFFAAGLKSGDPPEMWNIDNTDKVHALHTGFIDAGSDIILTNSFGGTANRLKLHHSEHRVHELNSAAASIARHCADTASRPVIVAGSMGPTGDLFAPLGELTHEAGVAAFREQAVALKDGGADVLWVETISSEEELRAAIEGGMTTGLPIVTTMSFDSGGRTMMGITPGNFAELSKKLPHRPAAIGANCGTGAPELIATILGITEVRSDAVVVAKGNCGIPQFVDGEIQYSGTPELMADYARLARDAGARIIGGCCGTGADHVYAMRQSLENYTGGSRPTVEMIEERLGTVSALAHGHDAVAAAATRTRRRPQRRCA